MVLFDSQVHNLDVLVNPREQQVCSDTSGSFSAIESDTDHIHSHRFISELPTARDSRVSAVLDTDRWGTRLKLLASMP